MGEHIGFTLPAPSGGINTIDPIDNMPPTDAQELINLYPDGNNVRVRGGYAEHCDTATGDPVLSLVDLPQADGTTKLLPKSKPP